MHDPVELNRITADVLDSCVRIHKRLGPGLYEKAYERILARDLRRKDHHVERQRPLSFEFEGMWFKNMCRPDLILDSAIVVEVKSCPCLRPVHSKQLLTYLRILDYRLGVVVNFGGDLIKDNFKRVVNKL